MTGKRVVLGHVSGLFGIKGWVKVYSYTRPASNLIEYSEWQIGRQDDWRPFRVLDAREQGKTLVAHLANADGEPVSDRDRAAALIDLEIAIPRDALPEPEAGEYYWVDLIGLEVVTCEQIPLGRVDAMMETGANDVLVVKGDRERLLPFVVGEVIESVDLDAGRIVADWDPDSNRPMRIDVVTLFPDWVAQLERFGVVGRGLRDTRLELTCWNPRDDADNATGRIDDRPYGGGPGMVMQAPPLAATLARVRRARGDRAPVIMPSPQGQPFDQAMARNLADGDGFVLVCGRYEGIDQRFVDHHVDLELSVGDVVLSGGELPAMMIIDATARLLSGVLGDARSAVEDSFTNGVLDHPHYTRPPAFENASVPEVLLSGDHAAIARWRAKQALGLTQDRRPDLIERLRLSDTQRTLLDEYIAERGAADRDGTDEAG